MALHKTHCPQIYQKVQKLISSAKTKHYNNRIIDSSSAKELHSIMNELPGTAKSPTLPTSYSTAELLSLFSSFLPAKIQIVGDNQF